MPLEARLLTGLALSVAAAYLLTPVSIRLAHQLAFLDRPAAAAYKAHGAATPYLGGAAVMLAFVAVLGLVAPGDDRTIPLVIGVVVLWAVGTADDRVGLSPRARVVVEAVVAVGLSLAGQGWEVSGIGPVDLLITVAWVLAVVNAFNLFDNMDGAAGSLAAVVGLGLAVLGVVQDDTWLAVAAIALAGACLGFLPHNLASPARIFLGDGGSMPIGLAVAAITMTGAGAAVPGWTGLIVGMLLVGIPTVDTLLVVISRRRRGISILTGGRDHLTHRARNRVGTPHAVAAVLGAAQAVVSALAILAARSGTGAAAVGAAVFLATTGGAIVVLERDYARAIDPAAAPAPAPRAVPPWLVALLLVPLGLGLGLSPFAHGFYDPRVWVPVAAGVLAVVIVALVGSRLRIGVSARLLAGGLSLLAAITYLSATWSPSAHDALVYGNRIALYAGFATALVVMLTDRGRAAWLFGGIAAGALAVGLWVIASMLGGGADLFVSGRLHAPLGYINGEASFFLLAMWISIGLAESRASPLFAGAGAAGAALFAGLATLGQSRGAGLAVLGSLVVVMVVLPGRVRRAWILLLVGAFVAIGWTTLSAIFAADTVRQAHDASVHAGVLLLGGATAVGVIWTVVCAAGADRKAALPARGAATVGLAFVVVIGLGAGLARQGSLRTQLADQWHTFARADARDQVAAGTARTRLLSGGGNRYEYWRVALDSFGSAPVAGHGAASYEPTWYRERRIGEDISQPHSFVLEVAGDTGLLGLIGLGLAATGVGIGIARRRRDVHAGTLDRALVVGTTGAVATWAVHSSVDWIHLLPGVTGIAVAAAAWLAVAPPRGEPVPRWLRSGLVLGVAAATVLVVRQGLADHERDDARHSLRSDPGAALASARRSLDFDPSSVDSRWLEGAALARFGEADAAEASLRRAARQEPENFVAWTLIGDLATRRGERAAAHAAYLRARSLNPRDPDVRLAVRRSAR